MEPCEGGFRIGRPGLAPLTATRVDEGWSVTDGDRSAWRLRRAGQSENGFLLLEAGSEQEAGRSTPQDPQLFSGGIRYLIVADGRIFRVAPAPPRKTGFELTGWETVGAYMIARPESSGWRIESTPAGAGMTGIEPLLILFAAEILSEDSAL